MPHSGARTFSHLPTVGGAHKKTARNQAVRFLFFNPTYPCQIRLQLVSSLHRQPLQRHLEGIEDECFIFCFVQSRERIYPAFC